MRRIRKVLRYYHNPRRLALLACSAVLVLGLGSVKGLSYLDASGSQASLQPNDPVLQESTDGLVSLRQHRAPPSSNASQQEQGSSENQAEPTVQPISSFETEITQDNQVASGTLIRYDSETGAKTYYGGDLMFSKDKIVYDKNQSTETEVANHLFDISSPDGQIVHTPYEASADSTRGSVTLVSGSGEAVSFRMSVVMNEDTPTGTYVLHLRTTRTSQGADRWQYDGFVIIEVIDSTPQANSGQ